MADDLLSAVVRTSYNHASPRTAGVVQDASKTHITSGVISANHWGSNISYCTISLSLCYSDDCVISKKNIRIELAALLLYHRKTLQKVTVTVGLMVNDCTTVSISDMSAVFKYYMVKNKSDTPVVKV